MENVSDQEHTDYVHSSNFWHNEEKCLKTYDKGETFLISSNFKVVSNNVNVEYPNKFTMEFYGPFTGILEYYFGEIHLGIRMLNFTVKKQFSF